MEKLEFKVPSENAGMRLDRFLTSVCSSLSRSRIQNLIDDNCIQVDGSDAKSSQKIRESQIVIVIIPDPVTVELRPEEIPITILFEDEHLIAVNKPRGMVVHPGAGVSSGTLVNALMAACTDLSGIGGELRPGIVHRLDRGTSGVIIVAKNDTAHQSLSQQFSNREIKKIYRVLVTGIPDWNEKVINSAIARDPANRKRMAVSHSGRSSVTVFRQIGSGRNIACLDALPRSGRTHQIRVHLSSVGYPVLGDDLYGERGNRKRIDPMIRARVKRMNGFCLHAREIEFTHPVEKKKLTITAPEPEDFQEIFTLAEVVMFSESHRHTES